MRSCMVSIHSPLFICDHNACGKPLFILISRCAAVDVKIVKHRGRQVCMVTVDTKSSSACISMLLANNIVHANANMA